MKNFLKHTLLLFLGFIISFFIAELAIRIFLPQQLNYYNPDIWRPDNTFGWRHQENANTMVNPGGAGLVHFRTDESGYRINLEQDKEEHNEKEFSILFLGDSFIEALQVENEETIPQQIKSRLSSKYDRTIRVYNSAVGGWDPNHYYLETKKVLAEKKIDLGIVFLYAGNDIVNSIKTSYEPRAPAQRHMLTIPEKLNWPSLINSLFYPINDFLKVRSHVFILLKSRMEIILSRIGLTARYFPEIFYIKEKNSRRWETTAEICKNIQDEFYAKNIPVIFILLPASYQVHEEIFVTYVKGFDISLDLVDLEQPNKLLAKYLNDKSITLLDPLKLMRERTNSNHKFYGKIDRHFNANGHQMITEFLLPFVEKYISVNKN